MTFAQRRNRLTTHFSEGIAVVKRRISVIKYIQVLDVASCRLVNKEALFHHVPEHCSFIVQEVCMRRDIRWHLRRSEQRQNERTVFYVNVTVHRDMWPCIVTNFFVIKKTRCTNSTNLLWHETLHVSVSSSLHHQEFIHCTFSNGPSRCTNSTNLFWHETLHVSDSSSVHHQEFIHCTLSNGICHTGL